MLESAHPLFEFETQQKGERRRLCLVRVAHHFWLQNQDLKDWLAIVEDVKGQMERAWKFDDQVELRQRVEEALENHRFGRALEWMHGNKPWILLWKSRRHALMNPLNGEAVSFDSQTDWHKGALWTQPNSWFRQRFDEEWQNPNCEALQAVAFLQADDEECSRWHIGWRIGGWPEVKNVVRAAMQLEFGQAATLSQIPNIWPMNLEWRSASAISPRLKALLQVVDERNVRSDKLTNTPLVVQLPPFRFDVDKSNSLNIYSYSSRDKANLRIEISAPSMHDKMEARHFLLGWLREHAPQLLPDWL